MIPTLQAPPTSLVRNMGGGDFVRGQCHGENFVFYSNVEIFPLNFFCAMWATSCSLCILSGSCSQVLLRCCQQLVCLSRLFILLA